MSDFLCRKLIIKKEIVYEVFLIEIGVFPEIVAAKYKILADERLCLNNLHKKLIRMVLGE